MLTFAEKGKPEQQTQLTYGAESGNRTRDHSGERRASCSYATQPSMASPDCALHTALQRGKIHLQNVTLTHNTSSSRVRPFLMHE
jgi:hypothetical protein